MSYHSENEPPEHPGRERVIVTDENAARIVRTAEVLLESLESPIAGQPSVKVLHRANARRLLVAAFREVYERLTGHDSD